MWAHISRALDQDESRWEEIEEAHRQVLHLAQVLQNPGDDVRDRVEWQFDQVLRRIQRRASQAGTLRAAFQHLVKVTTSYRPDLFHCYARAGIPRTNNDLEQFFGSSRAHERRISGRKVASPSMVIRGQVRLVAAFGTRRQVPAGAELQPRCVQKWRELRATLEVGHEARRQQWRFRRDPEGYLRQLELDFAKPPLPS